MEWDGQSPTEGEGLFPDHRDSKRTGDKRTEMVAGGRVRGPKFKIHGHQTRWGNKQAQRECGQGGWDQPQDPESSAFPQGTTNWLTSGKEESTKMTWYALSLKHLKNKTLYNGQFEISTKKTE